MILTEEMLKQCRMGPYQELAWLLKFEVITVLTQNQRDNFLADFVRFTEAHQLGIAGDLTLGQFTVVSLANRSAVTNKEQSLVLNWLAKRAEVHRIVDAEMGDSLSDAWFEFLLILETAMQSPLFDAFFEG